MSESKSQLDSGEIQKSSPDLSVLTSAGRSELLIEAVNDCGIYMLNIDGAIVSWNPGAEEIMGYRPIDAVGQPFSCLFTDEDKAADIPANLLREASLSGRAENEGWRVRKDGARFIANTAVYPVNGASGFPAGFAVIVRDITSYVASREALLETERRFRRLVEGVTDYAIYMLDPSGVITSWNTGAQRVFGFESEDIVGQHFSRFYGKEERMGGLPWRVLEIARRDGRYECEGWRYRGDEKRFWASVVIDAIRGEDGAIAGFAEISRDITEKNKAKEVLFESERQFRLLVDGVTDYALFMLDPNGVVTSWNAGAERIKGYAANEIVGRHFSCFYSEGDRAAGVPSRALQIAVDDGRFEAQGWRIRKDGSRFWASVVIQPLRCEDGRLRGFAKITQDITEKHDAEIALKQIQEQRGHAQRMEVLGELTGGVAHDFNNLLMVIGGFSQTLKKAVSEDARAKRAAEAIEAAVERGQSLTRQLLTFSRRQTLNPVVTIIGDRIKDFAKIVEGSAAAPLKLVTQVPAGIWPVKADVSEFELALLNVAINARDAMPGGGLITLTAENVHLHHNDGIAQLEGDFVALTIADNGSGIAKENLPKIFDPFFTTKGSGKGSGLGLSQVHGFAHQSGGTVTIESELGRGTRVTLYLPRAKNEPGQTSNSDATRYKGSGKALLVDDNRDVLEVSTLYLQELGYQVDAMDNAQAALTAINRENYSVVVSDIVMAGMNGIDLAEAIRQRHPDMPIVLVTGYNKVAASIGEQFVLVRKPYNLQDLRKAIARAFLPRVANLVHLGDRRTASRRDPQ